MKRRLTPHAVARLSAIVMTAILIGMLALTVTTLIRTRSGYKDVNRDNEVAELYTDLAAEMTRSSLFLANYLRSSEVSDMQGFLQAAGNAYGYADQIRATGTDQDRFDLAVLTRRNATVIATLEAKLGAFVGGQRDALNDISTAPITKFAADLSSLADYKRDNAVARSESVEGDLKRDTLLTIVGFALGLPVIVASYLVTRHYERKDVEHDLEVARLQQAALTDGLTNLANHRAFQEDLQREVARAARTDQPLSVAMIDVDDFKEVNDNHGHAQGDLVLSEIASVISYLRSQDRGYRVGGDEFALIMPDTNATGALEALQRLRNSVANGLRGPTISIGVSTSGPGPLRADIMRDHADAALYDAKHRGKNQVVQYSAELDEGSDLSAGKMQIIRRVLASQSVSMWFQPIFRIGSAQVLAFEALLRLPNEPEMSGPLEAFEVAQHMGRSRDLDMLCISKALDSGHELPSDAKLFLNIDPATLTHTDFSAIELLDLVVKHNVDPSRVVFEVTERTLAPIPRIAKQVQALRACGFGIALDDVGSGNSGLEMLRLIKFDYVKIDRSVVLDALNDGPGRAVILAIVAFAREAGAFMIAEGIETKEMLESVKFDEDGLKQFWVQGVQGFLMGEPGASIEGFLKGTKAA